MTDYLDPRAAALAHDRRLRELDAQVIETSAARDACRHMATLLDARDTAAKALGVALDAVRDTAQDLDTAEKAEARARQRTAQADVAVAKAQAEHARAKRTGTVEQETAARVKLAGQQETRDNRQEAQAGYHRERIAAALLADKARAALPGAELELAEREGAAASPGRAPVSHDTLERTAHMYARMFPPPGLPQLTPDEQQERFGFLHGAYTHPAIRPEHQISAADFQDVHLMRSAS